MFRGKQKHDKLPCCKQNIVLSYKKDNDIVSARNYSDHDGSENGDGDNDDEDDDIQISLAPYIQTYLAQSSERIKCCGVNLPILFERAATSSWWNFKFDSDILERQYKASAFCQISLRFRYCLYYMLLVSVTWCLYFIYNSLYCDCNLHYFEFSNSNKKSYDNSTFLKLNDSRSNFNTSKFNDINIGKNYFHFILLFSLFSFIILLIILLTKSYYFKRYQLFISVTTCIVIFAFSFLSVINDKFSIITLSGHFSLFLEILILVYTVIPLPLYLYIFLTVIYTFLFDYFSHWSSLSSSGFVRFLYYCCVHLIGIHILVMTSVRMRGTFMKVGQSLLVRRQLELEKQLKEKMIHSVMPPKVAAWLMTETGSKAAKIDNYSDNEGDDDVVHRNEYGEDSEDEDFSDSDDELTDSFTAKSDDIRSLFRPFNMHHMENVSILFADIVGFTKMSSNKTASQLVAILNDLFERFDELTLIHCCEKISTLGDCYYCVSGCPEPRPDHAVCCVEMGLSMIKAIADFERISNEGINMRVGIHTGTVLCGILGTKRVKFDVWSNDVTLANRMESTGIPGQVHLSDATKQFLNDRYELEDGEEYNGMKTYFVVNRKEEEDDCSISAAPHCNSSFNIAIEPDNNDTSINNMTTFSTAINISDETNAKYNSSDYQTRTVPSSPVGLKKNEMIRASCEAIQENAGGICKKFDPCAIDKPFLFRNKIKKLHSSFGLLSKIMKNTNSSNEVCRNCNQITRYRSDKKLSSHSLPTLFTPYESHHSFGSSECNKLYNKNNKRRFEPLHSPDLTANTDINSPVIKVVTNYDDTVTSVVPNTVPIISSAITSSPSPWHTSLSVGVKQRSPYNHLKTETSSKKYIGCNCASLRQQKPFQPLKLLQQQHLQQFQHPRPPLSPADETSVCLSINSRKDSGIRSSSSRRSSIQQQLYGLMQGEQLLSRRVSLTQSGYYTSSQFTINEGSNNGNNDTVDISNNAECNSPIADGGSKHLAICFQKLRKQSDLQLIRCVQDNRVSQQSYFVHPPLSKFTLFFKQNKLEKKYRRKVHRHNTGNYRRNCVGRTKIDCVDGCKDRSLTRSSEPVTTPSTTLANARVNTYLDITISFLVFMLAAVILSLSFPVTMLWLTLLIFLTCIYILTISICFYNVKYPVKLRWSNKLLDWYPWHTVGAVLVSMPIILIIFNFIESIRTISTNRIESIYQFSSLIFIGLIHFCNFTQLNCWMKNFLASLFGFCYILLIMSFISTDNGSAGSNRSVINENNDFVTNVFSLVHGSLNGNATNNNNSLGQTSFPNCSTAVELFENNNSTRDNITNSNLNSSVLSPCLTKKPFDQSIKEYNNDNRIINTAHNVEHLVIEIWFDIFLVLLLVWLLNREFEISYRLSFHSDNLATHDKRKIQLMKEQADCLLHNIIPQHVAEHLKNTARYSETVKNAGIIFASIVNFSEMYDESYLGGKECLRVLNELVSDFDELLNHEQFSSVEKIKTIGSTYMAASGLTGILTSDHCHYTTAASSNSGEDIHLFQLMEFALALQEVVNTFNSHLLEFNLILRIGYNSGDIVAGVIGTTKLHYDIWGDAVNIASRMDSTGVPGKIQVPSECLHSLTRWYQLTPRGSVYVKGKDHMNTYLLTGRKNNVPGLQVHSPS